MKRAKLVALSLAVAGVGWASGAEAARTLDDYRHYRALSIDLLGRIPTRAELTAFEDPSFDVDAWIGTQIKGAMYTDRLRRIYLDLLRLEVGTSVQFVPQVSRLRRMTVIGPDGNNMYIYYRPGQRRTLDAVDGDFCLTPVQTGYQLPRNAAPVPYAAVPPHPVLQSDLDAATVVIKPWWLYSDYAATSPTDLYSASGWATSHPTFTDYVPAASLLVEPDGMTPTTQIRICKEEAQTAATGTLYAPGHMPNTLLDGRLIPLPTDSSYVTTNKGKPVSCTQDLGGSAAADCGCGVGLERCLPGNSTGFDPVAFNFTVNQPIGLDEPTDATDQAGSSWQRVWWGEEASQFLGYIFGQDRDFREVLTAPYSLVNGPLAQFYKSAAPNTCCGQAVYLGYTQGQPLFDPAALPQGLLPHDTRTWQVVQNRGPNASGFLTMPVFLTKFGSRRARAHVLFQAFKCEDFIAGNIQLAPSTEPNLMIRSGCNTCHATLEPLAAYFSRIVENDWTFLPPASFPILNPACDAPNGNVTGIKSYCSNYYDPAFASAKTGTLRGAYPDTYQNGMYGAPQAMAHADLGPAGIANELISDPGFAACVAQNVASSLLGRPLTADDANWKQSLADGFVNGGYKMSVLVQAILSSDAYRASNNFTSTQWRKEMGQ